MNRVLITGIEGFCGRYLRKYLLDEYPSTEIFGIDVCEKSSVMPSGSYAKVDIADADEIETFITQCQPDTIFHLAGTFDQSNLASLYQINVLGTEELLRTVSKHLKGVRVVLSSSAAVYGFVERENNPIDENEKVNPITHYGISKRSMEMIGSMYGQQRGEANVVIARIFNMIGEGLLPLLLPGKLIRDIYDASNKEGVKEIKVGNIHSIRDFVDVRDTVKALVLLAQYGERNGVYNVGSGEGTRIKALIDSFVGKMSSGIEVTVDRALFKDSDPEMIVADISKIKKHTGWEPSLTLEQSLADIVKSCL